MIARYIIARYVTARYIIARNIIAWFIIARYTIARYTMLREHCSVCHKKYGKCKKVMLIAQKKLCDNYAHKQHQYFSTEKLLIIMDEKLYHNSSRQFFYLNFQTLEFSSYHTRSSRNSKIRNKIHSNSKNQNFSMIITV